MGSYNELEIENQELGFDTYEDIQFKLNMENEQLLEIEREEKEMLVFPKVWKFYDITTNQGNIHRNIMFLGYSNGVAKPKYVFQRKSGNILSINPSYEVEMQEIN